MTRRARAWGTQNSQDQPRDTGTSTPTRPMQAVVLSGRGHRFHVVGHVLLAGPVLPCPDLQGPPSAKAFLVFTGCREEGPQHSEDTCGCTGQVAPTWKNRRPETGHRKVQEATGGKTEETRPALRGDLVCVREPPALSERLPHKHPRQQLYLCCKNRTFCDHCRHACSSHNDPTRPSLGVQAGTVYKAAQLPSLHPTLLQAGGSYLHPTRALTCTAVTCQLKNVVFMGTQGRSHLRPKTAPTCMVVT